MPRPALPPTPQASTDIQAKQPDPNAAHDPSWTLPPAALARDRGSVSSSSVASCNASDSSYHPTSPVPVVAHHHAQTNNASTSPSTTTRKRSSNGAVVTKDDYSLPPPPTRLRKIIQMKPKPEPEERAASDGNATATANTKGGSKAKGGDVAGAGAASGKKKQASGSTPAGRKIARKTAHSLIERRRRSKMNEEFGVLKDMIPACAGQEMHKLAILQASIEYMRYLERCVAELKESHRSRQESAAEPPRSATLSSAFQAPPMQQSSAVAAAAADDDDACASSEDEEMSDALSPTTTTPHAIYSHHSHSHSVQSVHSTHSTHPTPSPALYPLDRHHNIFAPLTSPALRPVDCREDREATQALLMLNCDRRAWTGGRGMSVRDLLSG
ncbi:hypothetical protein K490DRAFT_49076 [Saccharata proteae CBS 121410]|uniref:BHLH domain-containing protein n=1 Tax=Saccharata proteae CBS 121410 TaxID=1314787 RepID=A0A9P4HSE2_9PEZI|nr:hypothetical protein K490DRAFT_49076 [Saccharata proteae CBS 121410]